MFSTVMVDKVVIPGVSCLDSLLGDEFLARLTVMLSVPFSSFIPCMSRKTQCTCHNDHTILAIMTLLRVEISLCVPCDPYSSPKEVEKCW